MYVHRNSSGTAYSLLISSSVTSGLLLLKAMIMKMTMAK